MTVTVSINGEERSYARTIEQWISQRLRDLNREGGPICVRISVKGPEVDLWLPSSGCAPGRGSGRPLTASERQIVDLWKARRLDGEEIQPRLLIAFLHQLKP